MNWNGSNGFNSEKGQMAIFIALIFQVLFVFFAMTINIGLLVHDKINLQNSVDLAAYYAAQKQADILNAIAHQNYQIRQSWKLLAWRVRGIGDAGRTNHPFFKYSTDDRSYYGVGQYPAVCWQYSRWADFAGGKSQQNVCYSSNLRIPELPVVPDIAGWVNPLNSIVNEMSKNLSNLFKNQCTQYGPMNWLLAAQWQFLFRADMSERKRAIRQLAENLSASPADFRDIQGQSAFRGARESFQRNLTRSNRESVVEIQMLNSFGGIPRQAWLNEMTVNPLIFYKDFINDGSCTAELKAIQSIGVQGGGPRHLNESNFLNQINALTNMVLEPDDENSEFRSIIGVEKNPWVMGYVGFQAVTAPRKPFAPFGEPVRLRARAFAKPFGGRIGPWRYAKWSVESVKSNGSQEEMVDSLIPVSKDFSGQLGDTEKDNFTPNFSRFPGDKLGLRSSKSLSVFYNYYVNQIKRDKFSFSFYQNGVFSSSQSDGPTDIMAWAGSDNLNNLGKTAHERGPWVREMELAAIAPNLFDIAYYSIDPQFYRNYQNTAFGQQMLKFDHGSRGDGFVSVREQIQSAQKQIDPQLGHYFVKDWSHLLTAWSPNSLYEYSFPSWAFGRCNQEGLIPSSCLEGGRTGYSVKLVALDYLLQESLNLGGEGQVGRLKNQPPQSWQ